MSDQLTPKEKSWLEMQEIRYPARFRDHQFFNALTGRHPIPYPALGLAITLLLPPPAAGMQQPL